MRTIMDRFLIFSWRVTRFGSRISVLVMLNRERILMMIRRLWPRYNKRLGHNWKMRYVMRYTVQIYSNGTVYVNLNWAISYSCDMVVRKFQPIQHKSVSNWDVQLPFRLSHMSNVLCTQSTHSGWGYVSYFSVLWSNENDWKGEWDPEYSYRIWSNKVNNEWALISLSADLVQEPYGTAVI